MKKDKIIYWIATSLIVLFIGLGSFADIFKIQAIKDSIKHLGFPEYIIPFFGVAKLLATIAIVIAPLKRFKEAAYACLISFFIGATYCHIVLGDGADKYGTTLFILITLTISLIYSNKLKVSNNEN